MLGNDAEILQIAATDGKDEFEIYTLPTGAISSSVSAVNKFTFHHGNLFYNSLPVQVVELATGLSQFITWLKLKAPCLLIAHNCKSFDARHLVFQRGGADGIELLLKEKFRGKPRVTAKKCILSNIVNYCISKF